MKPLMLSVQQEKFISILMENLSFILECGFSETELNRVSHIYQTNAYYDFDRDMLKDLHQNAKVAGLIL
jgi:hypothetical protein